MLNAHSDDRHVSALVKEVKTSLKMKNESAYAALLVFGVSKSKELDFTIPSDFPDVEKLVAGIKKNHPGLRIHVGPYGEIENLGPKIGLGFHIRENAKDLCKKLILTSYLTLQGRMEF